VVVVVVVMAMMMMMMIIIIIVSTKGKLIVKQLLKLLYLNEEKSHITVIKNT
jgi:lipopolysaccharide/colanic/teichoic acid biosynthesis glycosyltransferase